MDSWKLKLGQDLIFCQAAFPLKRPSRMPPKAIPRGTRKGLVASPPSALPQSGHPPRRGPRQGKSPRKRRLWRGVELRRGRGSFPTRASEPSSARPSTCPAARDDNAPSSHWGLQLSRPRDSAFPDFLVLELS